MHVSLLLPWLALTALPAEPAPTLPAMVCVERQGNASLWVQKRRRHPLHLKLSDTLIVEVRVDSDQTVEITETKILAKNDALWTRVLFETQADGPINNWQKVYQVVPLKPGAHALQLPALEYTEGDNDVPAKKVQWEPLTLHIGTRVAKVDISEARDITPIEEPPPSSVPVAEARSDWWWLLAGVPVAVVVAIWLLRRRRHAPREPLPRDVAAHYLRQLQEQLWRDATEVERWHTRLSDVLRWYLEKRLGLPATRQTTAEFFQVLQRSAKISAQEQASLNELLAQCDLAKFAGVAPTPQDGLHLVSVAQALINNWENAPAHKASPHTSKDSASATTPAGLSGR